MVDTRQRVQLSGNIIGKSYRRTTPTTAPPTKSFRFYDTYVFMTTKDRNIKDSDLLAFLIFYGIFHDECFIISIYLN